MVFPIHAELAVAEKEDDTAKGGGPIGGPIEELTARQNEVLALLKENNKLTRRDLATYLAINVSAAQAHIDALKTKGYIARAGGTRGYWKILK